RRAGNKGSERYCAGKQQPDKPEGGRFVCGHPSGRRGYYGAENQSQQRRESGYASGDLSLIHI
ncbi:type VI secretion system secreted protein VgrG, partial [Citrobacter freundii]